MSSQYGDIDEHIDRLKSGGTLTENEVKNLCEKVRNYQTFPATAVSHFVPAFHGGDTFTL
jgi:hypothetical protein